MTITITERISSLAAQLLVAENGDVAIYNLLCLNAPLDVLQKYKIKSLVEPYSELGHFQEEAKLLIERIRRMEEKVEDADMDKENMNSNPRKRKSSSEGLKIRIKIPKMCVPALSPDEFYEMHRDRIEHLSGIDLLHFSLQHQYLDEHLEKHFEKVLKLEFPRACVYKKPADFSFKLHYWRFFALRHDAKVQLEEQREMEKLQKKKEMEKKKKLEAVLRENKEKKMEAKRREQWRKKIMKACVKKRFF
uniref:Uncharacterized protein n=2 Tax=Caenorhabditis japonica TaxID=281687 RepID=A0A8R1DSE1_CAEJA